MYKKYELSVTEGEDKFTASTVLHKKDQTVSEEKIVNDLVISFLERD